jgi:TolB-like protein
VSVETGALISELKRRRVFRALIGYGIAAFAVLQIIEPVMHGLHWPDEVLSYVVVALGVGFPIVVSLAWIFDVKAGRIERTPPASGLSGARLAFVLVTIGVVAAAPGTAWYLFGRGRSTKTSPSTSAAPSIAVLPFADMSPGKDQEFFSDGIAEEILDALAQVDGLRVIGHTSSFSFKGRSEDVRAIGAQLGVAHVLEGSVRREGSRVRITAQLLAAADGSHVWSKTFERELTGIFAVQDEIARDVAQSLKVKLLPETAEKRPENLDAYEQVLLAKKMWRNEVDCSAVVPVAEKATQLDPRYAPAWSNLAGELIFCDKSDKAGQDATARIQRAAEAAEKAIALDPNYAEAYANRGLLRMRHWWDWAGAKADLERSIALSPGSAVFVRWYGELLGTLGRQEEALRLQRRAADLDPLWPPNWKWLARNYIDHGDYELGRRAAQRAHEMSTTYDEDFTFEMFRSYLFQGDLALAATWSAKLKDENNQLLATATLEHSLGHAEKADAALTAFIAKFTSTSPFAIAALYGWRGQPDRAFEWLEKAYASHSSDLSRLKVAVGLKPLHGDPRYIALLKKMNLPLD